MAKREVILRIMAEIEAWADYNDIATSAMDQIELAERIYILFCGGLVDKKQAGHLLDGRESE